VGAGVKRRCNPDAASTQSPATILAVCPDLEWLVHDPAEVPVLRRPIRAKVELGGSMAFTHSLFHNFVTSGFPAHTDRETLHRVGVVNVFSAVGVLICLLIAGANLAGSRVTTGMIILLAAGLMTANLGYLRMRRNQQASAILTTAFAGALFLVLLQHGGTENLGYLAGVCFPLFPMLALGLRAGSVANALFIGACAVLLYAPFSARTLPDYSAALKARFLVVLVGLAVMAWYAEYARTRSEQALNASARRFQSLIENGVSVYAIVAPDGTVLYESPSLERVYGFAPHEVVGSNIREYVHPDEREAALRELRALLAHPGQVRTTETRYRHKNGSWLDVEVSGVNLLDDPTVRGVVLTSHDITDRKQAELRIRALNQTLEERVRERTRELHESEEQLRQSEKMQAIRRLAGGIAHDFNNQLAAIVCCLDILKGALANDLKLSGFLEAASTAARRAAELTSQLLAFARRRSRLSEPVDIHRIVAEVVSLLKHSIDKRITIRQRLGKEPHVVMGDPTQLQSLLLNLAINARDAMPHGGEVTFSTQVVTVDTERLAQEGLGIAPGRYLAVSVSDTGVGMDEETQKRVFEPFFTTKPAGEGTGMGLAAAYGTARMHGGAIKVHSEIARGATFTLYLPAAEGTQPTAGDETPAPRRAARPARILLVDDEAVVRQALALALEETGHRVTVCRDGAEAVACYERNWREVDVVILDMVMPNLTGKETFQALHRVNPEAKVILASGYSIDTEAQDTLEAGALAFIEKPFKLSQVLEAVSETVRDRE
jgi:two-component system cell cycle sensor histidine kinase/response regulator CckA